MNAIAKEIAPDQPRAPRAMPGSSKASKKIEWQIDRDLHSRPRLRLLAQVPPGWAFATSTACRSSAGRCPPALQVQGRTYAYLFGLVERFISAKMLDQSRAPRAWRPAGARRPRALLRRGDQAPGAVPPHGADDGGADAGRLPAWSPTRTMSRAPCSRASTWAVLALTCHIELFVQSHYDQSIAPRADICPLFKDVFHFHWRDECQHVMLDELEWTAEHAKLTAEDARPRGR